MSEYTPTTDEVRDAWASWTNAFSRGRGIGKDEFDRWLAAEKAKWQAEALREAASDIRGWEDAQWLRARLRARAYKIEKGSDDDR